MKQIELRSSPNQEISVNLDGRIWQIRIIDCGAMAIDITIGGVEVIRGVRIVEGSPIAPYRRFWSSFGGLFLSTENDESPDWRKFGVSQWLFWLSPEDIGLESA